MLDEFQVFEPPLKNVNDYAQYLIDFLFTLDEQILSIEN